MYIDKVTPSIFSSHIVLIIFRSVYELYAQGVDYDHLHEMNRANLLLWSQYREKHSFKFTFVAYNHSVPTSRQREAMESFGYMGLLGQIQLKDPDIALGIIEECQHLLYTILCLIV